MAHGLLPVGTFEDISDCIAYQWLNKEQVGPSGEPIAMALSALDNLDLDAAGMIDIARQLDQAAHSAAWYDTLYASFFNSLVKHLQAAAVTDTAKDIYADIAAYILGETIRVHEAFNDAHYAALGTYINRLQVFDKSAILLGTINWTGSGTGSLTDGGTTDETLTGGNGLQWRIPTAKSVTSSVVDLTLKKPDATTEVKRVTIVGSAGAVGNVGTPATNRYTDLVSISIISGGANLDQAIIETLCDRDPALL